MRIAKFKEGNKIPDNSKFIKMETIEHRKYSNHSWCGCHDLISCDCYESEFEKVFWYEVKSEDSNEYRK